MYVKCKTIVKANDTIYRKIMTYACCIKTAKKQSKIWKRRYKIIVINCLSQHQFAKWVDFDFDSIHLYNEQLNPSFSQQVKHKYTTALKLLECTIANQKSELKEKACIIETLFDQKKGLRDQVERLEKCLEGIFILYDLPGLVRELVVNHFFGIVLFRKRKATWKDASDPRKSY